MTCHDKKKSADFNLNIVTMPVVYKKNKNTFFVLLGQRNACFNHSESPAYDKFLTTLLMLFCSSKLLPSNKLTFISPSFVDIHILSTL